MRFFLSSVRAGIGPHAVSTFERSCYWLAYAFTMVEVLRRPWQIYRTALRNPFVLGVVVLAGIVHDLVRRPRYDDSSEWWRLPSGRCLDTSWRRATIRRSCCVTSALRSASSQWRVSASFCSCRTLVARSALEGAWRGVFTTKNVLGEIMLLAVVVFGTLARRRGWVRVAAVLALIIAVVLIAFAKATAALLIVGVLGITIPVVLTFRRNNAAAALIFCTLLGVGAGGIGRDRGARHGAQRAGEGSHVHWTHGAVGEGGGSH